MLFDTLDINGLSTLTHVTFGVHFNMKLEPGTLPNTITHLTFGNSYNKEIQIGVLPDSITHLRFSVCFNKPIIPGSLPKNLLQLHFGNGFNQELELGTLPNGLIHCGFGYCYNQPFKHGLFPASLTHLEIHQCIPSSGLPDTITHLKFPNYSSQEIKPTLFPLSLKQLDFGLGDTMSLPSLLPGALPQGLTHITFDIEFNQKIGPGLLPNGLEYVRFGHYFNQPLAYTMPLTITHLALGPRFNNTLKLQAMPLLTRLTFVVDPDHNHEHLATLFQQALQRNITIEIESSYYANKHHTIVLRRIYKDYILCQSDGVISVVAFVIDAAEYKSQIGITEQQLPLVTLASCKDSAT
eukprot:gene17025-20282_t